MMLSQDSLRAVLSTSAKHAIPSPLLHPHVDPSLYHLQVLHDLAASVRNHSGGLLRTQRSARQPFGYMSTIACARQNPSVLLLL